MYTFALYSTTKQGLKTKLMYLILNNGGVIVDMNFFNCHSRHLSQEDSSESICDRSINTNHIKLNFMFCEAHNINPKVLKEFQCKQYFQY